MGVIQGNEYCCEILYYILISLFFFVPLQDLPAPTASLIVQPV